MLACRGLAAAAAASPTLWSIQQCSAAYFCRSHATATSGGDGKGGSKRAPANVRQAFSYCVEQVKKHDYETFLWIMQLPKHLRPSILALRAFNVETGLIQDHAKSEMLVLMRCQWWRDAVNNCFKGSPPDQPVVTALAEVLRSVPLTRYRLQQMVSTREEDLTNPAQPTSLAALERYAEGTVGQLLMLQLEAGGFSSAGRADPSSSSSSSGSSSSSTDGGGAAGAPQQTEAAAVAAAAASAAEHAAAHLGKAVGIAGMLRGTYTAGMWRRVYLPEDLCLQHGVDPNDVLLGRDSEGLRDVTLAVAAAAKQHLEEARRLAAEAEPAARPLFAPAVATGLYLDALEQAGFNLFDQRMLKGAPSPLAYQLRLKWALLCNKY
ncbi:hypothetical protein D9Q98_005238 [Chlorella vulgaris]|uniref:15-cis-phytoene synthase n=1 Tax=Chlorella vulgaris TaxID=3077 RepID=A0A9D4YWS6_CHLVU|nr:hypothetical protein D9Q98_005238 [Chlorella vulgaris]